MRIKLNLVSRTFISLILGFLIGLLSGHTASADPAVPFPWGRAHEVAFPWETVGGKWTLEPNVKGGTVLIVRSVKDVTGRGHLTVSQIDKETGRVLARGRVAQTEVGQTRVPVTLVSRDGRRRVLTFVQYEADTGETAFVAKVDGFVSLASTYVLKRLK